jgi:hypothetical protein
LGGSCGPWASGSSARGRGTTLRTPRHWRSSKNFPARLAEITQAEAHGKPIEVWFADEARIGQKNKITRRWARRGTRPRAPHDQRTKWAYIFGAICPAEGKGAGLVMPWCDTQAMQAHLIEISAAVAPGAHAVLLLDRAGWHLSGKLAVPSNITLLPLPPRSPELNPVERLAVPPRQLALEPGLPRLRRHRRPLLRSLERAHGPAVAHPVHRPTRLGRCGLINAGWYYAPNPSLRACLRRITATV